MFCIPESWFFVFWWVALVTVLVTLPLEGGVPTRPSVEEAEDEDSALGGGLRFTFRRRNDPSGLLELGLEITGGDGDEFSSSLSSSKISSSSADLETS